MSKRKAPFTSEQTLTEKRHTEAYRKLQRAEDNLARAVTRWQKARKELRYYDNKLDRQRAGQADWRELAKSANTLNEH
jgi:hypothetical protein